LPNAVGMSDHKLYVALYDAVQTRPRPEDVAELVLEALGPSLSRRERALLERAANGSLKRVANSYSSMAADFARPASAEKQVRTSAAVFGVKKLSAANCLVSAKVEAFICELSALVHKTFGSRHRMSREERAQMGLFKCQRWYNKRFRILVHLEDKLRRLAWETRKYAFTRIGKSALATRVSFHDLAGDLDTACFVAYLAARMSLRSTFTNGAQERAYDEVAQMLFARCERSETARWDVIAHVMPDAPVLRRLYDEDRGKLLGGWWAILVDMADMLHDVARKMHFDRAAMVVSRGADSSTWNQVAGGWNKAREHWIALLYAMGMESMLDAVCPGKVMRLMAADVAAWHRASGRSVHPDTAVWAALPPPWEVVRGAAACSKRDVEAACRAHRVCEDTWTAARKGREPVRFRPTPELVHGVAVASAELATVLRKAGVFSGKEVKRSAEVFEVERDPHGFALRAV
jgi:hypothetical protein